MISNQAFLQLAKKIHGINSFRIEDITDFDVVSAWRMKPPPADRLNGHPEAIVLFNNLGTTLANLEKYEEALRAFIKSSSEAQAFNNLGCILLSKGKLDKAIVCFEKAIELDPKFYAVAGENLSKARMLSHGSVLK